MFSTNTSGSLKSVFFVNDNLGYVVGSNGTILKTTNGGGTSINERAALQSAFSVFPNPAHNKIRMLNRKNYHENAIVTIYGITGKQLMQRIFSQQDPMELDVSALNTGLYLMKIETNHDIEVQKLIIQ